MLAATQKHPAQSPSARSFTPWRTTRQHAERHMGVEWIRLDRGAQYGSAGRAFQPQHDLRLVPRGAGSVRRVNDAGYFGDTFVWK